MREPAGHTGQRLQSPLSQQARRPTALAGGDAGSQRTRSAASIVETFPSRSTLALGARAGGGAGRSDASGEHCEGHTPPARGMRDDPRAHALPLSPPAAATKTTHVLSCLSSLPHASTWTEGAQPSPDVSALMALSALDSST